MNGMGMVFLLGSVALLLVAGALFLWMRANAGQRQAVVDAYLDTQLERRTVASDTQELPANARAFYSGLLRWDQLLRQAGITPTVGFYARLMLPIVLIPLLVWLLTGVFAAVAVFGLIVVLSYFFLWMKADRRLRRMIFQLPGFLDAVVRLITIGNSMGSAFQSALGSVDGPLRGVLQQVDTMARSGRDLDAALRQVSAQYGLRELYLVSAVVSVALRFGGRSDQVMERMAAFIRDLEQARGELAAMSSETRLSAWILALLPMGIAVFIIIFNNALFMGMWDDRAGFLMLMSALGLQIAGSYWLYRLAKSI